MWKGIPRNICTSPVGNPLYHVPFRRKQKPKVFWRARLFGGNPRGGMETAKRQPDRPDTRQIYVHLMVCWEGGALKSSRTPTVNIVNTLFTVFFLSDFTGRRPPLPTHGERENVEKAPRPPSGLGAVLLENGRTGERTHAYESDTRNIKGLQKFLGKFFGGRTRRKFFPKFFGASP